MKIFKIVLTVTLLVLSASTNAAFVERLGGLAYYDTEADLTWLSVVNYLEPSAIVDHDLTTWTEANEWATSLNVAGITGWRLPAAPQIDTTCTGYFINPSIKTGCTGSEIGNLWENVLYGISGMEAHGLSSPFWVYETWTATLVSGSSTTAFMYVTDYGLTIMEEISATGYALAVHTGDVYVIPIPAAAWLFASGLIGLIGALTKHKARV